MDELEKLLTREITDAEKVASFDRLRGALAEAVRRYAYNENRCEDEWSDGRIYTFEAVINECFTRDFWKHFNSL